MSYVLSIDAGGTYTDGVLLDRASKNVLVKAKVPTTHGNLITGIRNCMHNLITLFESTTKSFKPETIDFVTLSTTLATNAMVEGYGGRVGLFLVGRELDITLPVEEIFFIEGGHDINGKPIASLNIDKVRSLTSKLKGKVDAVAISSIFSVRNPEHELLIAEEVHDNLSVPVVCAHQLTTCLGFTERTVTAVFNARLLPIIQKLISSLKIVLRELKIDAPLMIVKANGSMMSENVAKERPVETILSGPTSSMFGAMFLTGLKDGLVIDMGGTTTDITILRGGLPRINIEGAKVGGWLTRVESLEMWTYGLGGDSYIRIAKDNSIEIGPQRVIPLCVLGYYYPDIDSDLIKVPHEKSWPTVQPTDCWLFAPQQSIENLSHNEKVIINLIKEYPRSTWSLAQITKQHPDILGLILKQLERNQIIMRSSLTPTDLLHVKGELSLFRKETSWLGVDLLAKFSRRTHQSLIEDTLEALEEKLVIAILQSVLESEEEKINLSKNYGSNIFIKRMNNNLNYGFNVNINLRYPIIGIGAPAKAYIPKIAKKLNTNFVIPEHAEVANAIGAGIGEIREVVGILIRPDARGGYILHTPWERKVFDDLEVAVNYALEKGIPFAKQKASQAGTPDPHIEYKRVDLRSKVLNGTTEVYIETRIEIIANGTPEMIRS